MYQIEETFKYLVDDKNNFCSVQDILELEAELGSDACWSDIESTPDYKFREVPWGKSEIKKSRTIPIDITRLVKLLRDSEKLAALENGGVDDWEWYDESLTDYFEDFSSKSNSEIINEYLND